MDEDEDRFRWCKFCGADCWPDEDDQEHKGDCPMVTGLWPVEETCRLCHGVDMACMDCGAPFEVGDIYVLRDIATGKMRTRPHGGEVVCVGCGANTEAAA